VEKDVLLFVLSGNEPVIAALARGLKRRLQPELAEALSKNRLLIITAFSSIVARVSQETANRRNELNTI
jgi:hypothetical protein